MFLLEPFLDLLFLIFWNMMPKNVILGPPTKSTGVQNGAQNLTSGAKRPPKNIRRCLQRAVLEATGDTEAPICARGTDLSIFCCIFQASKFYFFDSLHKCDIRVGSVAFSKPLDSTKPRRARELRCNRTVASFMDFRYIFHGFWTNC